MNKILLQKKDLTFLKKAIDNKETREALRGVIMTEAGDMATTDGRRLHILNGKGFSAGPEGITPGAYTILGETKSGPAGYMEIILEKMELEAPDVAKVIPDTSNGLGMISIYDKKEDKTSLTRAIINLYNRTGRGYQHEYLEALAPFNTPWKLYAKGTGNDVGPALLVFGDLKAVMMPMARID